MKEQTVSFAEDVSLILSHKKFLEVWLSILDTYPTATLQKGKNFTVTKKDLADGDLKDKGI